MTETTLKGIGEIPAVSTIKKPFSFIEIENKFIADCFPRPISKGSAICAYAKRPIAYPTNPPKTDVTVVTKA